MALLVQKFGGTSVADSDKILAAARRAIQAHNRGDQVLVVVSARGHTTDELIALAKEITETPPAREMDMLLSTGEQVSVALMAMAIESLGVPAISFTGAQIGLVTDSFHTKARIRNISTERMVQALGEGKIVIVAGFQGVDENYNITTLGRGGSDTTAVALAAVLGADGCEIYTDVDGVYTTDPRIVPEARKIDRISYDEMLELASLGAGVMHSRSIEFAKKYGVPIHVRSSFSDAPGTWIVGEDDARRLGVAVTGAALAKDEARITILGVPDRPGVVHAHLPDDRRREHRRRHDRPERLDRRARPRSASPSPRATCPRRCAPPRPPRKAIGASGVTHDAEVAKVSVVGLGMRTHTGVATAMFEALADGRHQHPDDHDQRDQDQRAGRSRLGRAGAPRRAPGVPARPARRPARRRSSPRRSGSRVMKLVPLADTDAGGRRAPDARDGRPGHRRRRARRVAGPDHAVRRPRPARLRGAGLPRDRRGRRVRRHDRAERRARRRFACSRSPCPATPPSRAVEAVRAAGVGEVSVEPALAKLSVIGVGHADPHRRRHPDVRRAGRARDQHQPDQHQRGPHQRRHRRRHAASEGLECLKRAFAL